MRSLVWFRGKDLRVADHGPLMEAVAAGEVVPVFVVDGHFFAPERAAAAPHRMQFLVESLESLASNLAHLGSRLVVVRGRSVEAIPELARRLKVDQVLAHRWTEPFGRTRDERVAAALGGIPFRLFEGETLFEPGSVRTGQGAMFKVYTPFSRACGSRDAGLPLPPPRGLPPLPEEAAALGEPLPTLAELGLIRNPHLQTGGEREARRRLKAFLPRLEGYAEGRDRLGEAGTSRLSADLKFGTLSVHTVWNTVAGEEPGEGRRRYLQELLWREFSHHLLWEWPHLMGAPFRPEWVDFPYLEDPEAWHAWTEGRTGFPVIDAAARELLETGYVHNRARMITASFLTKHLLVDWRKGEAHYLRWLTDGDWAQNSLGWQWSAGCGVDAQPWFRIFNPVTQGQRFDAGGAYVRRWVPELADLPDAVIHEPWKLDPARRRRLDYPEPIVDLSEGRARFLAAAKRHLGGPAPIGEGGD
ncbi:MAG TPA: deoxyribodipyrimidine photo-lyase [Holophagaceae bacterium]|nr:deoxyribodipyrimidine photo-lyase [Holophagaceae bacterium]